MFSTADDEDFGFPTGLVAEPTSSSVVLADTSEEIRCVFEGTPGRPKTRCKEWALPTLDYCVEHLPRTSLDPGALADETRLHAGIKLLRLAPEALAALEGVMKDEGAPAGIRAKAAEAILDRAGFRGGVDVHLTGDIDVSGADVIAERLEKLAAATALSTGLAEAITGPVEDAEIVEDEDEDSPDVD